MDSQGQPGFQDTAQWVVVRVLLGLQAYILQTAGCNVLIQTCVISHRRAIPAPDRISRQAWRKTNLSQKQGIRLNIHVIVRLIQWHSEVKLSLDVFQTYSSKNLIPYSAFVCPTLMTKLCGSPALFRDTERKRKPAPCHGPF